MTRATWPLTRRAALGGLAAALAGTARAAPPIRLGALQFGSLRWLVATMQRHGLDAKYGFAAALRPLANNAAGDIALLGEAVDVIVADWLFAAGRRAAGTPLCFAPLSGALGGIMVPSGSPIGALADLRGKRLGVAGGPEDKSWLLVRAAGRRMTGRDTAEAARPIYAAPPLLAAKLRQGELDAALIYWPYAARLRAEGYREAIAVADCAAALGLPRRLPLVGFVFREGWAEANRQRLDGLLAAAAEASRVLAADPAEWTALRPLLDARSDAEVAALRDAFAAGILSDPPDRARDLIARMMAVLRETGGPRAVAGLASLPPGLIWKPSDARG